MVRGVGGGLGAGTERVASVDSGDLSTCFCTPHVFWMRQTLAGMWLKIRSQEMRITRGRKRSQASPWSATGLDPKRVRRSEASAVSGSLLPDMLT